MSIPKEPRQLMINLMYLVLTALLALNVSAEVLQAFFRMDESLKESSALVGTSNAALVGAINAQADAYSQYAEYKDKAAEVQAISKRLFVYVDALKNEIVEAAGGLGEDGLPMDKRNKDVTTRLLVNEKKGEALEKEVLKTRDELLALVDEAAARKILENAIPLKINDLPEDTDKKNWVEYSFQQMPVAAVIPFLSKFQNDVRMTETAILNHFLDKVQGDVMVLDKRTAVVAAEKSYVIKGEEFRSELFLGAFSSTANNIEITVDGKPLRVEDGKAIFTTTTGSTGERRHRALIKVTDPITGETETYEKEIKYEVGVRSATVSADKMNVFYVGVDNPVSISVGGASSGEIMVRATGTDIRGSRGRYIAKPTKPGNATITVSGGGLPPTEFKFRVKRIPDPIVKLGGRKVGGRISKGELAVYKGIIPVLENFDFEARCRVESFEMARVRGSEGAPVNVRGGSFDTPAKRLINNAQRKDKFYFDKVMVRCPGDAAARQLNGMIFTIK